MELSREEKILQIKKAKEQLNQEIASEKESIGLEGIKFVRFSMLLAILLGGFAHFILDVGKTYLMILCLLEIVILTFTYARVRKINSKLDLFQKILTDDLNKKLKSLE